MDTGFRTRSCAELRTRSRGRIPDRQAARPEVHGERLRRHRRDGDRHHAGDAAAVAQRSRPSGSTRSRSSARRCVSASASGWRAATRCSCARSPKQYMKRIVDQFNLSKWVGQEEAREKLIQAGHRGNAPYVTYLFFRMVSPVVAFVVTLFYVFVVLKIDQPPMVKLGMCLFAAYCRHAVAVPVPEEQDPEAPALDPPRVSGCARPAVDLRRVRHVDRGGVSQSEPGDRLAVDPARRGTDADDRGTVLPAGPQGRLREPRQAHRPRRRPGGLRRARSSRSATARRSVRRCA